MAIQEVVDSNFEEKVLKEKTPVLIDFWAPWCGPCRMAEPVLEELAEEYQGKVKFVKINVDENQATSVKYQIMSIPTTVIIKNSKEVDRQIGFAGKEAFVELIKKVSGGGD